MGASASCAKRHPAAAARAAVPMTPKAKRITFCRSGSGAATRSKIFSGFAAGATVANPSATPPSAPRRTVSGRAPISRNRGARSCGGRRDDGRRMTRAFDDMALPNWPLYLSRDEAARYVGVSPNTFDAEVMAGMWPGPMKRGSKGSRVTWYRPAIEQAAEERARGQSDGRSFESWRARFSQTRQDGTQR